MSLVRKFYLAAALVIWTGMGSAFSENVTLAWDPSPSPNVIGYHLYYGIQSRTYTNFVAIGQATSVTISNLTPGLIYYFAATTIDTVGLESEYSAEIAYIVGSLPCDIIVSNLVQAYDGTPKSISVSTTPANLPVIVTYAGMPDPPSEIGQYPFTVIFATATCIGGVTGVLTIKEGDATVILDNLAQVYDGAPRQVLVRTIPADLPVSLTYNGLPDPPTQAGTYQIVADVLDPNYAGSAIAMLTVAPANAQILLNGLDQTYNGTPKAVSATTIPPNLALLLTYNGGADLPTDAGTYDVSVNVNAPDYVATTNALFIINKATAAVQLANLIQTYNGAPKPVGATTVPLGLNLVLTYNGREQAPSAPGNYSVIADVSDPNYAGSATGLLTISLFPGLSVPIEPLSPEDSATIPLPLLLLSWPSNNTGVTIWQSRDMASWNPVTNLTGDFSGLGIIRHPSIRFFKATTLGSDGSNALPLSIGMP